MGRLLDGETITVHMHPGFYRATVANQGDFLSYLSTHLRRSQLSSVSRCALTHDIKERWKTLATSQSLNSRLSFKEINSVSFRFPADMDTFLDVFSLFAPSPSSSVDRTDETPTLARVESESVGECYEAFNKGFCVVA